MASFINFSARRFFQTTAFRSAHAADHGNTVGNLIFHFNVQEIRRKKHKNVKP